MRSAFGFSATVIALAALATPAVRAASALDDATAQGQAQQQHQEPDGAPVDIGPGVSRAGFDLRQAPGVRVLGQAGREGARASRSPSGNRATQASGASRATPEPMPSPQSRQLSQASLPPPNVDLVNEALDQVAPLTPEDIHRFRREMNRRSDALSDNVSGKPPVMPKSAIYTVDLSPAAVPPVVRIAPGMGAIVSFLDQAGRPWPARFADNFNSAAITVSQFTENQLSISATPGQSAPINVGVAVALKGLPTAITFSVISGQPVSDVQVRMVIPRYYGPPPGEVGILQGQPSLHAGDLMAFLLRTPPASARSLTVQGLPDALAWQVGPDRMVLRTTSLVTTGYFLSQGLGDGTLVYELPLSPVVRVAVGDSIKPVEISGFTVGGGAR